MAWRLAKSLETLRAQINTRFPKRSKVSDGTIGDASHQARSKSDHNPNSAGVVTAFDITRDPANGPDLVKLIPLFLKDKRTKYVIFDKKIYNPAIQGGKARPYTGANAHKQHLHISVSTDPAMYDRQFPWALDPISVPLVEIAEAEEPPIRPLLRKGSKGEPVRELQRLLGIVVDGDFGPATLKAVQKAQEARGLKVDGLVGNLTWKALSAASEAPVTQEQTKNWPQEAIKLYESLGWSKLQAVALTANLMWESGGNTAKPQTIIFNAKGDMDKGGVYRSHGAGQWNERAGRFGLLKDFAAKKGKPWTDEETQLLFLDHELNTPPYRKFGVLLRAAETLEEAMAITIKVWGPSIPHADRRLAIAKSLL
jgi:hypothetical protein